MLESDDRIFFRSWVGRGFTVTSDSVVWKKSNHKMPLSLFRRLTIDLVDLLVLNLGFRLSCVLVSMCGRRMFRLKSSIHCELDQWLSFLSSGGSISSIAFKSSIKMMFVVCGFTIICLHTPETLNSN